MFFKQIRVIALSILFCAATAHANGHIDEFHFPDTVTLNFVTSQAASQISPVSTNNPLVESFTHELVMKSGQTIQNLSNVWVFHTETFNPKGEKVLSQDLYRKIDKSGWIEYVWDPQLNIWKDYLLIPLPIKGNTKWNSSVRVAVEGESAPMYRQRHGETLFWEEVKFSDVPLWCFKMQIKETIFNPLYDEKPNLIVHRYWFSKLLGVVKHEAQYGNGKIEITKLVSVPEWAQAIKTDR